MISSASVQDAYHGRNGLGRRRGFALLVILCLMVSAGLLTSVVTLSGRDSYLAARNRVNSEKAFWRAEECLALARERIDAMLYNVASNPGLGVKLWRALDTAIVAAVRPAVSCTVSFDAAGSRVDVNGAEEPIRNALRAIVGMPQAGALMDALSDWRDADTVARTLGAESPWYAAQGRYLPRNDSVAHIRELARIRGFDVLPNLGSVLSVEPGRISINNAPSVVLSAVPGFTAETVSLIESWRRRGWQVSDLLALESSLSRASADSLLAHFPEISRLTVLEPEAWIVTSTGRAGIPAVTAVIELRIIRTLTRAVIVRRRSWW